MWAELSSHAVKLGDLELTMKLQQGADTRGPSGASLRQSRTLFMCIVLCLVATHAHAAHPHSDARVYDGELAGGQLQVEGFERDPIPGASVHEAEGLVKIFEDVFDEPLLKLLDAEAQPLNSAADAIGTLRNNKRATLWWPFGDREPRTAGEYAIHLLRELTFPGGDAEWRDKYAIVGAKYWYQYREASESVGFHFDKDEGLASNSMKMVFPKYNTLLYLTDEGAPTVFFNQTVIHNGNVRVPRVPEQAWLIYPKRGKFAIQRGDLNHGAASWMTATDSAVSPGERRVTFVVSFETFTPEEPNCHMLTDDEVPASMWATGRQAKELGGGLRVSKQAHVVRPTDVVIDGEGAKYAQPGAGAGAGNDDSPHDLAPPRLLDGGRGLDLRMQLPSGIKGRTTYYVRWKSGDTLNAVVPELDLDDDRQQQQVWSGESPVAIIFSASTRPEYERANVLQAMAERAIHARAAASNASAWAARMLFLHGDAERAQDAMEVFGIDPAQLPAAAVHITARGADQKFAMRCGGGDVCGAGLTAEHLQQFYEDVLWGRREELPPGSNDGEDEEEEEDNHGGEL